MRTTHNKHPTSTFNTQIHRVSLALVLILMQGCASYTKVPPLESAEITYKSYVAGIFTHSYRESFIEMGLLLVDESGKEYVIELERDSKVNPLKVISLPNGAYTFNTYLRMGAMAGAVKVKIDDPTYNNKIHLKLGEIAYIGEIDIKSTNNILIAPAGTFIFMLQSTQDQLTHALSPLPEFKAALIRKYPTLKAVEVRQTYKTVPSDPISIVPPRF